MFSFVFYRCLTRRVINAARIVLLKSTTELNYFFQIRGHAKFIGYTGPVQMGYEARTFSTHKNNGAGTFFIKHIQYTGQILFCSFLWTIFYTRYYLC